MNELSIIKDAFTSPIRSCENPDAVEEWARFGFFLGFRLFEKIRFWRLKLGLLEKSNKSDGSPATNIEDQAELFTRESLAHFFPEAGFWGEESGSNATAEQKFLLTVDPIDGTRSFLSGFDTYSITISILKKRKPIFSLIVIPASGDFGYRIDDQSSRIFQYPLHSEEIELINLPYIHSGENAPLLVNIHPSVAAKQYVTHFYQLWDKRKIALVKSVSGSPSMLMLEVARGAGVYLNIWSAGQTMPFDLIGAMHILLGAGGDILDLNGKQIDPWKHQGPFLAGRYKNQLTFLAEELRGG